jgi:hypothetical protein
MMGGGAFCICGEEKNEKKVCFHFVVRSTIRTFA